MRAISLFSGGLDSMLAAKLIVEQGVDVIAIYIQTGFGGTSDASEAVRERASMVGADFVSVDVREEYIAEILFDPVYGYGKNFNPCIDCHGYMFKIARAMMSELDASFLITGEVVGQRPMSQRVEALRQVERLSGGGDEKLILRPLSARLLEPTLPEMEGWVDRDLLLDISGRSRERQLAMARSYGWDDYESPAGGCLLTDPAFSRKLKDFITYEKFEVEDIDLLKYGRHFRLPDGAKLVVGRHREDNEALMRIENDDYIPLKLPVAGPFSLLYRGATPSERVLAARIALTYGRSDPDSVYSVTLGEESLDVMPFADKGEIRPYFAQY